MVGYLRAVGLAIISISLIIFYTLVNPISRSELARSQADQIHNILFNHYLPGYSDQVSPFSIVPDVNAWAKKVPTLNERIERDFKLYRETLPENVSKENFVEIVSVASIRQFAPKHYFRHGFEHDLFDIETRHLAEVKDGLYDLHNFREMWNNFVTREMFPASISVAVSEPSIDSVVTKSVLKEEIQGRYAVVRIKENETCSRDKLGPWFSFSDDKDDKNILYHSNLGFDDDETEIYPGFALWGYYCVSQYKKNEIENLFRLRVNLVPGIAHPLSSYIKENDLEVRAEKFEDAFPDLSYYMETLFKETKPNIREVKDLLSVLTDGSEREVSAFGVTIDKGIVAVYGPLLLSFVMLHFSMHFREFVYQLNTRTDIPIKQPWILLYTHRIDAILIGLISLFILPVSCLLFATWKFYFSGTLDILSVAISALTILSATWAVYVSLRAMLRLQSTEKNLVLFEES